MASQVNILGKYFIGEEDAMFMSGSVVSAKTLNVVDNENSKKAWDKINWIRYKRIKILD